MEKGKATHSSILAWRIPWTISKSHSSSKFQSHFWTSLVAQTVKASAYKVGDPGSIPGSGRWTSLSITNSWSLLKLMSIELVMPSNHLILFSSLPLLPSILPSIGVFSSESVLHIRWPKYWSFSFSISPSNEYSGLISFRMDW